MQPLLRTPGAWPYLMAIILNAFVDLGHKIVIQNTIFKSYDGKPRLAEANGFIQTLTIGAMLAGTVAFTALFESSISPSADSPDALLKSIAPLGWPPITGSKTFPCWAFW